MSPGKNMTDISDWFFIKEELNFFKKDNLCETEVFVNLSRDG